MTGERNGQLQRQRRYITHTSAQINKYEIRARDKRHDDDCDSGNGGGDDATLVSAATSTSVRQWK